MDNARRMRLIAELMKHLEDLDSEDLGSAMKPKDAVPQGMVDGAEPKGAEVTVAKVGVSGDKGPMEKLMEDSEGGAPKSPEQEDEDELSDEDFEDLIASRG